MRSAQALTEEAAELEGAAPELAARAAELLQKLQSEEEVRASCTGQQTCREAGVACGLGCTVKRG